MDSFWVCFVIIFMNMWCSSGEMCGGCFCKEESATAECFLNSCKSLIVQSPEVEIIIIRGHLCENHIKQLEGYF